jgi:hypothetical protein
MSSNPYTGPSSDKNSGQLDEVKRKYYGNVMDILQVRFQGHLVFTGIIQDGKLLDYRRGSRGEFALPPPSQDALDVKLSLVMDVAKTLETVIGLPKAVTIQFQNLDLVVIEISAKRYLYVLCVGNAEMIAQLLKAVSL